MASVSSIGNNTKSFKSSVFDSCNFEGEHYADTRNTRKQVNTKQDKQKVKWQAKHDYWQPKPTCEDSSDSDDEEEQPKFGVQLTDHGKKTLCRDFHRWVISNDKKAIVKGAKKRNSKYQQFNKSCF